MPENEGKVHLLYDEGCSLCVKFQQEIKRQDRRDRVVPVGFQDPQIPRLVPGMTPEQLRSSFHLVFPDGRTLSGPRALPSLLKLLPGWKISAWLLERTPGAGWLSERVYHWIATHR